MLDTKALDTQIASSARSAVLDAVRGNARSVTLAELLKLVGTERGAFLGSMTLSEIGSGVKKGPGRPKGKSKGAKAAVAQASSDVDTRNKESREMYRRMVLQTVQKSPGISAQEVRAKVGGSDLQVRTALNFHRDAGLIVHEGATRNRVYSPKAS